MEFVGDLKELPAVLGLVGLTYNHSLETGRNASANLYTITHFPRRVDLLTNQTILKLCKFLAMDYYLLDYPLPEPCQRKKKKNKK